MAQPLPKSNTERDLKEALNPIADSDASTSTNDVPGRLSAVSSAILAPLTHARHKPNPTRILSELAPVIMTPKMIHASSSSAVRSRNNLGDSHRLISKPLSFSTLGRAPLRLSLGSRRITSTDLQVAEATSELLNAEIPDTPDDAGVSLLRGFKATIPSSERGKVRRRKVRNLDTPHLGLKKMGMSARGMLGDVDRQEEEEDGSELGTNGKVKRRKRRRQEGLAATVKLDRSELVRQKEEIKLDKENLGVRRALINSEISDVSSKISALESIRQKLENDLLKLQEEELELDDELAGILERAALEDMPANARSATLPLQGQSSRRRKGPAFLPEEHDELPPGLAFMTLKSHTAPICALDFSEPYGMLVSAGQDDSTRVWDLCEGEEIGRLRGHSGTVKTIQVENTLCLTGGTDAAVRLWDLRLVSSDEPKPPSRNISSPRSTPFDIPAGTGTGGEDWEKVEGITEAESGGSIRQGGIGADDAQPTACLRTLEGHTKAVTSLYFEQDSLVTGASDKTIRQWDLVTGQCVLTMDILWAISHPPPPPPSAYNHSSQYSPSHQHYEDTLTQPYDTISSSFVHPGASSLLSGTFAVPTPAYSDGSWDMYQDFVGGVQFWGYALVSGSGDGAVRLWDMRTGQAHKTLMGHTAPVTCLQFDEQYIVSGSLDKTIRIWDLRTGGISETIRYDHAVTSLQFDSRKIVACTGENGIKIYNRTTLQQSTLTTNGHTKPVERLRYIDRYLVSGGRDSTLKVWSL